eukprot:gene2817-12572_t
MATNLGFECALQFLARKLVSISSRSVTSSWNLGTVEDLSSDNSNSDDSDSDENSDSDNSDNSGNSESQLSTMPGRQATDVIPSSPVQLSSQLTTMSRRQATGVIPSNLAQGTMDGLVMNDVNLSALTVSQAFLAKILSPLSGDTSFLTDCVTNHCPPSGRLCEIPHSFPKLWDLVTYLSSYRDKPAFHGIVFATRRHWVFFISALIRALWGQLGFIDSVHELTVHELTGLGISCADGKDYLQYCCCPLGGAIVFATTRYGVFCISVLIRVCWEQLGFIESVHELTGLGISCADGKDYLQYCCCPSGGAIVFATTRYGVFYICVLIRVCWEQLGFIDSVHELTGLGISCADGKDYLQYCCCPSGGAIVFATTRYGVFYICVLIRVFWEQLGFIDSVHKLAGHSGGLLEGGTMKGPMGGVSGGLGAYPEEAFLTGMSLPRNTDRGVPDCIQTAVQRVQSRGRVRALQNAEFVVIVQEGSLDDHHHKKSKTEEENMLHMLKSKYPREL